METSKDYFRIADAAFLFLRHAMGSGEQERLDAKETQKEALFVVVHVDGISDSVYVISLSLYIQDRSLRSWSRSARDFTAIDLAMNPSHPDRSRRSYLGLNRAGSTPLATKHSAALPGLWPAASLEL